MERTVVPIYMLDGAIFGGGAPDGTWRGDIGRASNMVKPPAQVRSAKFVPDDRFEAVDIQTLRPVCGLVVL
jgi:hypothetical protein